MPNLFYRDGLCFSCIRCSACCRYESGFVFLSEIDIASLVQALAVSQDEFIAMYCRWVPFGEHELISLKEKQNLDCIFWKDGCSVYENRPLQCRTFPFWDSVLVSADAWKNVGRNCPGLGKGSLHTFEEIEGMLRQRDAEPIIRVVRQL